MPTILSKIKLLPTATLISSAIALRFFIAYRRYSRNNASWSSAYALFPKDKSDKRGDQPKTDGAMLRKLAQLVRILIPGLFTAEAGFLAIVAAALVARTYADLWMIQHTTSIEAAIIARDPILFAEHFLSYLIQFPSLSVINNLLKLGLNQLKLLFRRRLTEHLYGMYMENASFYRLTNAENRLANPDHILTEDVAKFCDSVVALYSNVSKPILDSIIYAIKLTNRVGIREPSQFAAYIVICWLIDNYCRRPLVLMIKREQQLEGEFRHVNSRVLAHSEEIAFYKGSFWEMGSILTTFKRLTSHLHLQNLFKFLSGFAYDVVDNSAYAVGYLLIGSPFFFGHNKRISKLNRSGLIVEYYTNGRLLLRLSQAVARLVLAGRELAGVAGYTLRIDELESVLIDTKAVSGVTKKGHAMRGEEGECVLQDNLIRFENVPLVTPNGDVLIESLDFEVLSGVNVLVCGPNGCGKSSLFRVLGGLWPLWGGRLIKPASGKLFYIPQRPYMVLGTLRDQVIYPDSVEAMRAKGVSDGGLEKFLQIVCLSYILEREGGWDAVQDWMDVLSGGEKQRVAMARLFYHAPQFAILDECTSAVSVDVEHKLYTYCREVGITLFTVSHRKSLWKHHNFYLHMDGRGSYQYLPIHEHDIDDRMQGRPL